MSRWFRHYAGMMRDDKLVRVAIRSGQTIERVVWVYGAILESAAEIDDDGRFDLDAAEVAYFLRAAESDVDAILCALSDAGRVAENRVVAWGNRQFQSDRSKDRVAAHRERKRAEGNRGNGKQRAGNGAVTLQGRHRNAPEQRTEPELETETTTNPARASDCFNEVCNAAGWHPRTDTKRREGLSIIDGWLALGCSLDLILESVKYGSSNGEPTASLKRFDGLIRKKRRDQLGGAELPVTANDVQAITRQLGSKMRAA